MDLPQEPPLDEGLGLSLTDVQGCIWYVWKRSLQITAAYPNPADLMRVKIKDSYPPRPWGVGVSVDGPARKFFKDIQDTLERYTAYRADLGFSAFAKAYDDGRTWSELAATIHANAFEVP